MHLFSFKVDGANWPNSDESPFSVDYYGVGYDPTKWEEDSFTGNSATQLSI